MMIEVRDFTYSVAVYMNLIFLRAVLRVCYCNKTDDKSVECVQTKYYIYIYICY